uniref:Beta-lactamase domain-containing protein n=1 Tax=Parastrongyloides trichosuri TaxID=131310 RepID=A0A0N5A698_PARTI
MSAKSPEIFVDGKWNDSFSSVVKQFKRNFEKGWESEGSNLAVFYKGECVINIYGGYADKSCYRKWTNDTMSVMFSMTKSVASICLALLIDQGHAFYDDLITKYWPEFGCNGKENITIEMILNHRSGLVHMGRVLKKEEIFDRDLLKKAIENMKPVIQPNTKTSYHAIVFGWIVDILIEKIDPAHRTVSKFLEDEFSKKYDLNIYIGTPPEYFYRMTRIKNMKIKDALSETICDLEIGKLGYYFFKPSSPFKECMRDISSVGKDFTMFNNPEILTLEFPSAGGVGNAYSIAKIHDIAFNRDLINSLTMNIKRKIFKIPQIHFDHTTGETLCKGYGFIYTKSKLDTWQIGHHGIGGQNVKVDWINDLSFCYITNGLKAGAGQHIRTFKALENAIYTCIVNLTSQ